MDKKNVMKKKETKNVSINIKITQSMSKWMRTNKYSPTRIFIQACKELGFGGKKQ